MNAKYRSIASLKEILANSQSMNSCNCEDNMSSGAQKSSLSSSSETNFSFKFNNMIVEGKEN